MMRIRVMVAALAAAGAATALTRAQPAAGRGVTAAVITLGLEEQVNSFSADEEKLGFASRARQR